MEHSLLVVPRLYPILVAILKKSFHVLRYPILGLTNYTTELSRFFFLISLFTFFVNPRISSNDELLCFSFSIPFLIKDSLINFKKKYSHYRLLACFVSNSALLRREFSHFLPHRKKYVLIKTSSNNLECWKTPILIQLAEAKKNLCWLVLRFVNLWDIVILQSFRCHLG